MKKSKNQPLSPQSIELIREEVDRIIKEQFTESVINEMAEIRLQQYMLQIPQAQGGKRIHERVYCKFSCEQLLAIFGGWFTLKYAFTTKYANPDGTESETDFYVCSRDVSMINQNERPKLNEPLYKAFGVEVYGFAIIAPSTAF